ncbi:hypothetical protein K1T71_005987 [Dendrolimus kikuchii]|uniref:Uncharacterized protein n=1 Tax=Dendrolimus kikuchii TaxID=765133 RepID=A0ACC1D370_9NEOP|nr:hypothetical protein K1T71_005987 [Dendrolimus kikuchii]
MSQSKNTNKLPDKCKEDTQVINKHDDEVTVSTKPSVSGIEGAVCTDQKSFISIHSTDQLRQVTDLNNESNLEECNLEVLSLNEVFPSTSEESLSNDDETISQKKRNKNTRVIQKIQSDNKKSSYMPTNSKSTTGQRQKETIEGTPVYSDFDIPKNTLYVVGSNPGEPKMSYQDPPKKISKTMKKFLRNIDKHKNDQNSKNNEKAISKLTTMRGILKDGRCGPECTGDSSVQGAEECTPRKLNIHLIFSDELSLPYQLEFCPQVNYGKQNPDKNVTFNTQVVIIHFTGDLCVGQSVETLSKEKDQQARNSELRKTFLTKYNEFWPSQK